MKTCIVNNTNNRINVIMWHHLLCLGNLYLCYYFFDSYMKQFVRKVSVWQQSFKPLFTYSSAAIVSIISGWCCGVLGRGALRFGHRCTYFQGFRSKASVTIHRIQGVPLLVLIAEPHESIAFCVAWTIQNDWNQQDVSIVILIELKVRDLCFYWQTIARFYALYFSQIANLFLQKRNTCVFLKVIMFADWP